jgi:glycosyltransferase involved in cell wall biosynthesis
MNSPQVTVLTAVRNGQRYLPETIACIQAQTFSDWEYIIVDDASTDNTVNVIEAAQRNDPRLRLVRRAKSQGPYTAANDGMQSARGKYIVRIDADDLCPPHRIQRQLEFLAAHPENRACVSYWQALNDGGLIPNTLTVIPSNPRVFRWALLLRGPSIHSTACFERSAIRELGGYRELPLSQDYRLWCELTRRGWLGTIPEVLCYVRYHEKRQSSVSTELQAELALDVLSDHLFALIGQRWSNEDLYALASVGASLQMPIDKGTRMLDRWDDLWQADPDLTAQDRAELGRMSTFRRWKHLRANARPQPVKAMMGLLKLATTKVLF